MHGVCVRYVVGGICRLQHKLVSIKEAVHKEMDGPRG